MPIFAHPEFDGHERVVFGHDAETGLNAIIAIHNTNRGPALGGCRMWPYGSEDAALVDALRLSQAMTYKHALAGTGQGGGKAVIIGDAKTDKTPALMRAMGRAVDALGGRYIVAEDVGTSVTVGAAGFGQAQRTGGASQELDAEVIFERIHVLADNRFRAPPLPGGRAEAASIDYAHEGLHGEQPIHCSRIIYNLSIFWLIVYE